MDICIYTGAVWNGTPNGLSTWIDMLLLACPDIEFGICAATRQAPLGGAIPGNVRRVEGFLPDGRPPLLQADRYLLSGPIAASVLRAHPQLVSRAVYVEHGDAVREALVGDVDEGGKWTTGTTSEVQRVAEERHRVAATCALTVGVTRRTQRRLARARIPARTIGNAVPALAAALPRCGSPAFVGRLCRTKGLDRIGQLADLLPQPIRIVGPNVGGDRPPSSSEGALASPWRVAPAVNLLPSRSEASPFSVLEAEARGVTSLCTPQTQLSSPLIRRIPWDAARWVQETTGLMRQPLRPILGSKLARRRWSRFQRLWTDTLTGSW